LPVDAETDDDANWIISDTITTNIKRISAKHIMIVADSCYSGTLTRAAITDLSAKDIREKFLQKMLAKPSRTLMASGGNEPVSDSGGSGHSIFADVFLTALKDMDEKVFTATELFYNQIRSSVAGRSEQTPAYDDIRNSGHDNGDFVFKRIN